MFNHAKIVQALRNDKKKVIFFCIMLDLHYL